MFDHFIWGILFRVLFLVIILGGNIENILICIVQADHLSFPLKPYTPPAASLRGLAVKFKVMLVIPGTLIEGLRA